MDTVEPRKVHWWLRPRVVALVSCLLLGLTLLTEYVYCRGASTFIFLDSGKKLTGASLRIITGPSDQTYTLDADSSAKLEWLFLPQEDSYVLCSISGNGMPTNSFFIKRGFKTTIDFLSTNTHQITVEKRLFLGFNLKKTDVVKNFGNSKQGEIGFILNPEDIKQLK